MFGIGVLGINFKTADLALRESMARGAQALSDERAIFFRHPVVVLSTCNRTEIYFSSEDLAEAHSDLLNYLRKQIPESFEHRLYSYFGIDCFAHLCRVTAGLDSAILAETEIQRQVKVAYSRAKVALPSCLHFAFQKALKVGKGVRSHLEVPRGAPTLYGTLWQLAEWKKKRILLVGYSEINRGFSSFLLHKGVERFSLCTRTPAAVRIENIATYDRSILKRWQEFDLIVCASHADEYLIQGEGSSYHILFDLSVPRNIDPQVGRSSLLYNIDQLMEQNSQHQQVEWCEAFVWESVLSLSKAYRIKTLHAQGIWGRELHL